MNSHRDPSLNQMFHHNIAHLRVSNKVQLNLSLQNSMSLQRIPQVQGNYCVACITKVVRPKKICHSRFQQTQLQQTDSSKSNYSHRIQLPRPVGKVGIVHPSLGAASASVGLSLSVGQYKSGEQPLYDSYGRSSSWMLNLTRP
jgi:hypothetical protein